MTRVVLDAVLREKLIDLSQPLELCDESGEVVAHVTPVVNLSEFEAWEPSFTEEELRRQEQAQEKRYTTAEVLAHLEKQ